MPDATLFDDQAHERPDAASETGRKIVYEADPDPPPTLPDGRYNGSGDWSHEALESAAGRGESLSHQKKALLLLYRRPVGITSGDFYEETREGPSGGSMRLAARIKELRHDIEEAPPIETDRSGPGRATYYIPEAG